MKLDRNAYRTAVDRIHIPAGLEDRLLAGLAAPQKRRRPTRLFTAAVIAVALTATLGITAAAIEAKEYRDAINFFASNSLSTDGLDRDEIKAVHRDITSGSFVLAATNSLILREYDASIEGQVITPKLLENLWNNRTAANSILPFKPKKSDYAVDYAEQDGVFTSVTVSRRDGAWTVTLNDFYIDGMLETPEGLLLYGNTHSTPTNSRKFARVALISDGGQLRWEKQFGAAERDFAREMLSTAVAETDRILLFGRGDLETMTVTILDYAGRQLGYAATPLGGPYGIRGAVRLGEGYLVRVANEGLGEHLLRLDREGALVDRYSYTADDRIYRITDMREHDGRLYLSGYSTPKIEDIVGTRGEIDPILEDIFSRGDPVPGGEMPGLVDNLRATYTAVLFVCDPATGAPAEFYSVEGAMGDVLAIDAEGNLTWDTAHFTTALFSPMTSAFTVAAECRVLRYTFDAAGNLIRETATDRTVSYTR